MAIVYKPAKIIEEQDPLIPLYSLEFCFAKAGNAIRTRDIHLGKVTLYH
jgi:hypothetical protein